MAELKPCPFCGGEAKIVRLFTSTRYDCFVKCTKCDNESGLYTSKQNAVKEWNRRFDNE